MAATTISSVTLPGRGVRVMRRHGDTDPARCVDDAHPVPRPRPQPLGDHERVEIPAQRTTVEMQPRLTGLAGLFDNRSACRHGLSNYGEGAIQQTSVRILRGYGGGALSKPRRGPIAR